MITVTGSTMTELTSGTGYLNWWVDILTTKATPEKYTFRTIYDSAWADSFEFGTVTGLKGDVNGSGTAHLKKPPAYSKTIGKEMSKTSMDIIIVRAEIEGGDIADFLAAIAADELEGADMAFGFYSPVSAEKVVIDTGRCYQSKWDDLIISIECINSVEMLKTKLPTIDISLDQWECIEDTEDNPDPDHPFQQLTAAAGTAEGRWRKGLKKDTSDFDFTHPFPNGLDGQSGYLPNKGMGRGG